MVSSCNQLSASTNVPRVMMIILAPKGALALHDVLVRSTMRAPMSFFEKTDTSVMLNRFSQDMTLLDVQLPLSAFVVFNGEWIYIPQSMLTATSNFAKRSEPSVHLRRLNIPCDNSSNLYILLIYDTEVLSQDFPTDSIARFRGEKSCVSTLH